MDSGALSPRSLVYAEGYLEERAMPTLPQIREIRFPMTAIPISKQRNDKVM